MENIIIFRYNFGMNAIFEKERKELVARHFPVTFNNGDFRILRNIKEMDGWHGSLKDILLPTTMAGSSLSAFILDEKIYILQFFDDLGDMPSPWILELPPDQAEVLQKLKHLMAFPFKTNFPLPVKLSLTPLAAGSLSIITKKELGGWADMTCNLFLMGCIGMPSATKHGRKNQLARFP